MKTAAGMTMVQSLAGSCSGLVVHRRNNFVHRGLVWTMGLSGTGGALLGSVFSKYMSGQLMLGIFAILAVVAGSLMFFSPKEAEESEIDLDKVEFSRILAALAGFTVGLLGGIIGQGGAFLMIPLMLYLLKIPTRIAMGSSVAIAFLSAAAGFIGKWGTNQIPFGPAAALAIGAVIGAQAGGVLSKRTKTKTLRIVLGVLILGTALKIGISLI